MNSGVSRCRSFFRRKWKTVTILLGILLCLAIAGFWTLGSQLCSPSNHVVGSLPPGIRGENVELRSTSGSTLHGWLLPGVPRDGTIILMHGVRGDRTHMLSRAQFLNRTGYSVLLFDFQAHGESAGAHITFGHLESEDATAAVEYARTRMPGEKIAVIGSSLGGAAALLADPPLKVDAMVLEMVYPTIEQATSNRLAMRFGEFGRLFTPLLICQLKPRIGVSAEELRPIDRIRHVSVPKLIIGGSIDQHTTVAETRALFDAAAEPKELWIIEGAAHTDMYAVVHAEYEKRVLVFLGKSLR